MNKPILFKVKFIWILLITGTLNVFATSSYSSMIKMSIKMNNVKLEKIFETIEERSEFSVLVNSREVNLKEKVSINVQEESVEVILNQALKNKNLTYEIKDRHIIIYKTERHSKSNVHQQSRQITGKIIDERGEPVIGANVVEKGTTNGTITDFDGNFTLMVNEGATLLISYIGYLSQEVRVDNRNTINITIHEDTQRLEEVVVVGYGTQKRVNLTGAVDMVTEEVFENRPLPNVTQALQGAIPNLNLDFLDGKPTQSPSYNIRGNTSIGQEGNALVLIDGVEGDPSMLNPNDIGSVSVLKDAASAAIYGARGVFGVILITTKNPAKEKTTISYNGSFSVKRPTTVPDLVTDGYTYAKYFNEAWTAWNDYSQTPQNVNKTLRFSPEYLAELKRRSGQTGLPQVEIDPATGNYVYYGNTDWYDELYKKNKLATDHNLSVTGSTGKLNYYITGRYYGEEGLFRYNSDDYNLYNFRGKGSIQVF